MANIKLKGLLSEAEDFQAKSKESGKMVHFKSKDSYQAALKAGTHEDPKAKKGEQPKGNAKPNDMFGGDYSKDRGGVTSTTNTSHTPIQPDSEEVKTISKFTSTREKFIADFINKHKLDASALSKFIEKGSLRDRMDVGTAMVGNPGNKYEKDLIKKFGTKEVTPKSDMGDWMDDLDSIDTSDIKGKANPDADSWKHDDVFGATFKDPKTGKTTTVGDAYDREDDSPAYQKAFAYVSKFDPDGEAVMGTQAYDDLQKNASPKADVKSIVKDLLKTANKEFAGAHKLKDVVDDFKDSVDDSDADGKELKARLDKGENGIYVQTDETEGTVVFNDGSQYQFSHVEDGPIPVTKVGNKQPTQKREGDTKVNKTVIDTALSLDITPMKYATSKYEEMIGQAAVEALTDANFHAEARELIAKLEGKPDWAKDPNKVAPEYGTPEYKKWRKNSVYSSKYYDGDADGNNAGKLGRTASQASGWDGVTAVDAIAAQARKMGSTKLADTLQSVFDDKSYMKPNSTKLTSMLPKKDKSITDVKVDKQVDVSTISNSILPNLRLADGSGYPDKDAAELKKRLDNADEGVYTRTSPHGGNIVFKDGTKFEVYRPHDAKKTKSTKIYASKR